MTPDQSKAKHTYVNTSTKESTEEEHAVQDTVGDITELNVLHTTSAKIADSTEHADGAEGYKAHDGDLSPWRVVCMSRSVSSGIPQ